MYAFVHFKKSDAAAAALSKPEHVIRNRVIVVKAAQKSWPSLLEQDFNSHILNVLNNDCLQEIFKHLNAFDLKSVAETCIRFNQLAKETFRLKYRHLKLRSLSNEAEKIQTLFFSFGSLIQSLEIVDNKLNYSMVRLILRDCPHLKALSLEDVAITCKWIGLQTLFARIEALTLKNVVQRRCVKNMFAKCLKLRRLTMKNCRQFNREMNQNFPNLQEVEILNSIDDNHHLYGLIRFNPTLVKLSIGRHYRTHDYRGELGVLQLIARTMPNLQSLEMNSFCRRNWEFQDRVNLRSLKVFKMNFSSTLITSMVRALAENEVPIEHFIICFGKIDKDGIQQTTELKLLTVLEFDRVYDLIDDHLIALAKGLPKLQKLYLNGWAVNLSTIGLKKMVKEANQLSVLRLKYIYTSIAIDFYDYKTILETVQKRPEKMRLVIEITGNGVKFNVPEDVLNENRATFFITEC